jgi:hypothetical protein
LFRCHRLLLEHGIGGSKIYYKTSPFLLWRFDRDATRGRLSPSGMHTSITILDSLHAGNSIKSSRGVTITKKNGHGSLNNAWVQFAQVGDKGLED